MKNLIVMLCTILASSTVLADTSGLSKNSAQMRSLTSAIKSVQHAQLNKKDITMVYGGDDLDNNPMVHAPAIIA